MALVPCKVCGTLNSENTDICLSCEYPIQGRRRPMIFQWAAIVLLLMFAVPVLYGMFNAIQKKGKPAKSQSAMIESRPIPPSPHTP